jgi:hypothetical protein
VSNNEAIEEILAALEEAKRQSLATPERIQTMYADAAAGPEEEREGTLLARRIAISRAINEPWMRALDLMNGHDAAELERDGRVTAMMQSIWEITQGDIWQEYTHPIPPGPTRKSNRKIALPWPEGTLFPMPNIQNHGTRNLVRTISGSVEWIDDPANAAWKLAVVNGQPIGRIDLTPGGRGLAERELTALVGPKAIKTMVATSRLIFERTNRQPLNKPVTLTVGEVARAAGYEPGQDRGIKPEILLRIGHELRALTRIMTWAADGPYDRKTGTRPSAWIAPLISITAVHVEQNTSDGRMVPYEFDAMLGRNWAQAFANTDLLQVAAGFMELDEDNTIRLGWYYLTEFRYQMTSKKVGVTRKIAALCEAARIDTGQPKHRGRFLDRLEKWHDDLQRHGVIGFHRRSPGLDTDHPPSQLFSEGEYFVRPPAPILEAYAAPREKAAARQEPRRRSRQSPEVN